jgi:hypothetical protein
MLTCYYCEDEATVIFNDDKIACESCKEERLDDRYELDCENNLWWPLPARPVALAA